jgi:WD40 repeat protein
LSEVDSSNLRVLSLCSFQIAGDYLVETLTKLAFPSMPLLYKMIVVGTSCNALGPCWDVENGRIKNVKHLSIDSILSGTLYDSLFITLWDLHCLGRVAINAVPTQAPSAPAARTAARADPLAIPPAAMTGISGNCSMTAVSKGSSPMLPV